MNEAQRQGGQGGTFTVKADVILHAVHADLASPTKEGGALCPVALRQEGNSLTSDLGFPKDDQTFCSEVPPALMTFQKEYLLDSGFMENHHNDHQPTDASYTSNADQFHISNDHPKQLPSSSTDLNDSHGRNGISEGMNGARAKVPYSAASSTLAESRADQEVDVPLSFNHGKDQCQNSNVTTPSEHGTVAPDTHCIAMGRQPTTLDLGLSSSAAAHTAEPTQYGHSAPRDSGLNGSAASKKEPDLVIEVGGQKISAHKSVLAEKSDYFRARLSRDILKVKGVNYKTLSILIDYIYTSQMRVQKENVVDVITGAKILQVPCAVQAAVDSMSEQITPENCYEVLTIAKKQRLSELKETAYRFMSDNFLQVLRDPAVYGRLNGSERDLILKKRMEGKKSLMVAEINDVFDRVGSRPPSRNNSRPQSPLSVASFEDSHMIYYFNETANDWRPLTVMPEDINTKGCGICTMYNYLFVAGGIKGYGDKGKVSDKVFCYNPITNRWSEIRPLNQARSQLKLVSMDGSLYAIGGECLFTVEKYDPRADRWSTVAPLPKGAFAVAHEATTCNGELYVSGGSLFYRLLRYDIKRDEWQECPYNNSRKKSSDMVALKSFIYRFDVNREQGINVFKYNTIVKMWHDCASQRQGSPLPFRCAVIGNCIYCVNKTQTLQFIVEEENAYFVEEPLRAPLEAKGILFPFILSLPEKPERIV